MRTTARGTFIVCLALAVLVPLFGTAAAQGAWTCPEGFEGQRLNVYNWSTYIADDTIANFEAACGVTVVYDTYPTDDDMLVRLRQGNPGFDVVVPSDVVATLMIQEGLLARIDHANIPNLANLGETFLDLDFDPGNRFTVPYQWGTTGIGYNVERTGEVDSWEELFNYDGTVAWLDDVTLMIGVALIMTGNDPNSSDPEEIEEAKQFLVDHGDNVVYIAEDDGQEMLARGEIDMVIEYSGDVFQVMDECECDDYAYVIPSEGTNFWIDSLAIPVGAPNQALAEVFIDYILHPAVGADISNYTAYGTPNAAALEQGLIDEELAADPGIYPSTETQERLFFATQNEEREVLLNDAWDEIKILVGR
ncbi:MAG TPA: spermidine/putrescine ABC transporter substrate-binding protein [Trueperaceae bacterium]|nr:spermidine/putrescine ABC transporter substrate-binding protein [Trueperaceae bacterium]